MMVQTSLAWFPIGVWFTALALSLIAWDLGAMQTKRTKQAVWIVLILLAMVAAVPVQDGCAVLEPWSLIWIMTGCW